jgi:predicted neuraminidase
LKSVNSLIILFLIFVNFSCNEKNSVPVKIEKEITLRLEPKDGNPRNSEGDFIRLKDGRILFVYTHFTGGEGDHATAYLAGRVSSDFGKTWTDKDILVLSNEGDMNIMSVSLLRLSDGLIALFYLRKNSDSDCIPIMRISTDEAETWSDSMECIDEPGYYVMNNDRAVQIQNGRIILPFALHKTPETEWNERGKIICYYSDDIGKTWQKSVHVPNPNNVILQEPGIIELKTGNLMMFCRTNAGSQYLSFSTDSGQNWSAVQSSNITSPMSPASIERIPSTGDLLLVWNNTFDSTSNRGGKRTPFNIAISKDDGENWENIKTLEDDPNGWYCYTAIEFINNSVLIGHCSGNREKYNGLETTQITRLYLKSIYEN